MYRALFANKAFLLLALGRLITNAGDSVYLVATLWYVSQADASGVLAGVAGFLVTVPQVFQFIFGPLVDRLPVKPVVIGSQVVQGLFVILLLALVMHGVSLWVVLPVVFAIHLVATAARPAYGKWMRIIVPDSLMVHANSVMGFASETADLIFNALSGVMIAAVGVAGSLWFDVSTFAVAAALFGLIAVARGVNGVRAGGWSVRRFARDLVQGLRFVHGTVVGKIALTAVVANGLNGMLLPILPRVGEALGGAEYYGLLVAAESAGIMAGTLVAPLLTAWNVGVLVIGCMVVSTVAWAGALAAGFILGLPQAAVALFGIAWLPVGVMNVVVGSAIMVLTPVSVIGRVGSAVQSISTMAMPLGALVGGLLAGVASVRTVFGLTCLTPFTIAVLWIVMRDLRAMPPARQLTPLAFADGVESGVAGSA
ncbi:MFS transporter [Thermaerobacter litoralis]